MTDFIYLYYNGTAQLSPEQAQANMQKWMDWLKALGEKGHIKDAGAPLETTGRTVKGKPGALTDGPFVETKDVIGGYSVVVAKDLDEATQLSKGCPIFDTGGYVEVRPVRSM